MSIDNSKRLENSIFDKRIVIDEKAVQNLLNANSISASQLKNADRNQIKNVEQLVQWLNKNKL